jgi:two-component system heavy metal sensor histidine kinase CusS
MLLYEVARQSVYRHIDDDLDAEALQVQKGMTVLSNRFQFSDSTEWAEEEHNHVEVNPMFLQVIGTDGKILKKSFNLHDTILNHDSSSNTKIYSTVALSGSIVRQLQLPVIGTSGSVIGYLLVAMPVEEATVLLSNLRLLLIVSFPIVLIAVFFLGRLIAGRSIIPMGQVISTAEKISKENLDERIPLPVHRDELYQLAFTINRLLDRLRDAVIREKQFTSDASHELRTPLTALKGTLEVLIRKPRDISHYEEKIAASISEVNRLARLVDQLLTLARIESGQSKPAFSRIDLKDSVSEVLNRLEPMLREKKIKIQLKDEADGTVSADPSMLSMMFENVISNAIKYSHENGILEIYLQTTLDKRWCVIKDHGIGIPVERVSHIFERFYRGDESRSSGIPGFGVGLAIVKRLADLQNLSVHIESEPGFGTSFMVVFPN